jgi:hypothetical protein
MLTVASILFSPLPCNAQDREKIQNPVVQEVQVTNVEVAVRVFDGSKPLSGLQKNDFKLLVNGKEREINGFYEVGKDIVLPSSSRLFVLIFNICDYRLEIDNVLDTFFDRVFKPNDRLIVITKNFFIDERSTMNPQEEKIILRKILQLEKSKTEEALKPLEQRLKSLVTAYKNRENNLMTSQNASNAQDFVNAYIQLVDEFKKLFLDLSADKYIQLVRYLKNRADEKWVLSFYQVGRFLKPKFGSDFYKTLQEGFVTSDSFGMTDSFALNDKLREAFDAPNILPQDEMVKLFINTGATFHTMVMEDGGNVLNDLSADFIYTPVVSDSYRLLKNLCTKSGGRFFESNEIAKFYREVIFAKDIHYILTYVPGKEPAGKNEKIKIIASNKNYKVYYDDQKRGGHYLDILKKAGSEAPVIRIEDVTFENQVLSFVVSNFVAPGSSAESAVSPPVVKFPVRIQVYNKKSETLFDGVQMFELKDTSAGKARLQIGFPSLPPDTYDVFIWVADRLSGQRAVAVKEIDTRLPKNP